MFRKLGEKWKVSGWQLFIIICCFAIAGSLTGYTGRQLMGWLHLKPGVSWWMIYILLITLLWPVFVILIGFIFGQYAFFSNYLSKMGSRIFGNAARPADIDTYNNMVRIAVFASGTGTNAARIIEYFNHSSPNNDSDAVVALVVCNKPGAGVIQVAEKNHIPVLMIEKERFFRGDAYLHELKEAGIDFIVLAGFLWKIPFALIAAYPGAIVNIHPALLPKYGGKGMYGQKVHEAVIANKDSESGISIHWVDEQYDHGAHIFQARCPVLPEDTPESLAARIHSLEHQHYPVIIRSLLLEMK